MIIKVLIFTHYKQSVRTIMKTNTSNYINNSVFFQIVDDKLLYLIAFFSKNFNFAEYNYKIYHKKLLAIMRCFEK